MNVLHASIQNFRTGMLAIALLLPPHAMAQMDPTMQMPMPTNKPAPTKKPAPKRQPPPTDTHAATGDAMGAMPAGEMQSMDPMPKQSATASPVSPGQVRQPIEPLTDADRAAAFPQVTAHPMHDNDIHSLVLFDRFEAWNANNATNLEWEGSGWIGTDLNRVWLRSEGQRTDGHVTDADIEVLYGHSIATWWDVLAGVRHDFKPGASQDFAAIGISGLAPGKFEIKATAYIGQSGQTAARIEAQYELLLTNRLIVQPLVEVNFFGRSDARRSVGSGLSTLEAGLRMRYEITRQFAPYIGVVRECAFGGTADFRHADGEHASATRYVAGLRFWF